MITIPLLLVAALYLGSMYWIAKKLTTWVARIVVVLLFFSPAIYVVWTYQAIKHEHQAACAREGGLKVFIQPEKVDRVQLAMESFNKRDATGLLREFSPRLSMVEAWDGNFNGKGKRTGYFSYTLDPATTALPKKDWKFAEVPLSQPTEGMYVLSRSDQSDVGPDGGGHRYKTIDSLKRDGKLYASWTMLQYFWSHNPGLPIGWTCFAVGSTEGGGKLPHWALTDVVLN